MGLFVEADRAYIFDYDFENQITINTFEWCREGIEPQIDNLKEVPLEAIPQWVENHLSGRSIYVADVLSLDENDDLRQVLEPQEIKSLIAVPMMDDNECIGFLGFDSVKKHHSYTQKEKSILEVFAQIVVNLQNRYQSESQLKLAKEKAEKAEKAQFEFLSTMSHEIRTPLNAVIGLTNILLMESPKPEQLENLNTLKFSARNLMSIINDILDYNKLLSGNVVIDNHDFSLKELLDGMYLSMSSLASSKEIEIKYSIGEDTPEIVVGDSTRLLQIINNLVSNAIKFTHKGFVEIKITKKGFKKGFHQLEFSIEDTGIGIPEDKYETIFEEFRQTSGAVTREYGGTGLGLPIVKQLLNMMGSEIQFKSQVGVGTMFCFTISFKEGDPNKVTRYESILQYDMSLANIRVLLVEDNKINQMVALKFLHEWKCEVDTAENGEVALEKVELNRYDAILMDLHMPVMDGYTATKKIREHPSYFINRTPIIALSASALGEIETKARNYGMNDFITKPFNPNALFKALLNQTVVKKSKKR